MNKLKHTPGPWSWQEGDRYIRIHDEESGKVGYWNESQKIAETYYVNNSEETISNNLLIAAAPEMLEMLICIAEADCTISKELQDIIEKATGLPLNEVLNEN